MRLKDSLLSLLKDGNGVSHGQLRYAFLHRFCFSDLQF